MGNPATVDPDRLNGPEAAFRERIGGSTGDDRALLGIAVDHLLVSLHAKGRKGGQRSGDFGGYSGVVLHKGHVGLEAGTAGGLADMRQQEGCYVATVYSGSVGCGQTTRDGISDGLWVGLVGNRDGISYHYSAG